MNNTPPPQHPLKIKAAPRIRQVYWCEFPNDAQKPEFWKVRPVVIISRRNPYRGIVTVIPLSTEPQGNNKYGVKINTPIASSKESWAVCNHIVSVATSRLSPDRKGVKKISQDDFDKIVEKALSVLPETKRGTD